MSKAGTISGIECAFGARWDDVKEKATLKTKVSGTIGYYDGKQITTSMYPAPSVLSQVLSVEDRMSAYAVFYHDDIGEIFASVVFSGGQIAPLSETIYENHDEWLNAITRTTHDNNIDYVYLPEGAIRTDIDKVRFFMVPSDLDLSGIDKITTASNMGTIAIVALMALILTAIPIGAWIYIAKPFEKAVVQPEFVIEKLKPDFDAVLEQCATDISNPWPAPPEWTLVQEGCVLTPEMAVVNFPKPVSQQPYAYRFYDLDVNTWDDYLSRQAFLKIAERFPGTVIEGINQFVLIMPYDLERNLVPNRYVADTDPSSIMQSSFVGVMKISANAGVSGSRATTTLELEKVIDRLVGKRLTTNHVYRNMRNTETGVEYSPERIETRQVRVE